MVGQAWCGEPGSGKDGIGKAWQARLGAEWRGMV